MTDLANNLCPDAPTAGDREALAQLRRDLIGGSPWYLALLDAVALWGSSEETYQGQRYRYLVANEAFDWLRLAERLCDQMLDLLPSTEMEQLLFYGRPPMELDEDEFRRHIGSAKYRAHLNFFYGVTVEQALILAVEEEVRKEAVCGSLARPGRERGDPYERIYALPQYELLARFRADQGQPAARTLDLTLDDLNAFAYWLFKYRLKWCDKARVASDTKKGLTKLQHLRRSVRPLPSDAEEPVLLSV